MRGDEARVIAAFCAYLRAQGWTVATEVAHCDVRAERDGSVIYAEAKGRTSAAGLDVDTAYGQLLRRMPEEDEPVTRYAIVVPTEPSARRNACPGGSGGYCGSTCTQWTPAAR